MSIKKKDTSAEATAVALTIAVTTIIIVKNNLKRRGVLDLQFETPQNGLADLGEKRRLWSVRRTRVRRALKSAVEKVRVKLENYEEIEPITVSFFDCLEKRNLAVKARFLFCE